MFNFLVSKYIWPIALLIIILVFWMKVQKNRIEPISKLIESDESDLYGIINYYDWSVKTEICLAGTINYSVIENILIGGGTNKDTQENSKKFYMVNTEGCRIPMMDAFDESIRQFLMNKSNIDPKEKPFYCTPEGVLPLVASNLTHLYIESSALTSYNLTQVNCCYQPFWRKTYKSISDVKEPVIDLEFESADNCIKFEKAVNIGDNEFVKVECTSDNSSKIIYKDFHSFVPVIRKKKNKPNKNENKISVLILGVDAVSRLNLIRQMPTTLDYVKNYLGGVEMLGYNKVDDNTFPNLVPVLTGYSVEELSKICWPTTNTYFDECPFLWKNFSDAGYNTCFAEDASWMGIFNYVKQGFFKQPTDYYWGMYNRRMENEIGSEKRLNAYLCVGYRMTPKTLLDYAKKFAVTMSDELSFGLFWGSSLSHDFLNLPMYGDDLHKTLLSELHKLGILNNNVLVFMSDHGIRWGGIRSTYQGYLEERLPFLYFVFPNWFKMKYTTAISNLRRNSNRLTTPYDLHKTLTDLFDLTRIEARSLYMRIENGESSASAVSLFLPVSTYRNCSEAKIPGTWCTCHSKTAISVNDTDVVDAANHLVKHINSLVVQEKECMPLNLSRIISARIDETKPKNSKSQIWDKDFLITIETIPGKGMFESTIKQGGKSKTFSTIGTVSRINTYGNQSACTNNYRLRLYCYCQHQS